MQITQKSVAVVCLIFFLIGCATLGLKVKRTTGDFDTKTRIYKNYDHNLQFNVPGNWAVVTGDALYRLPFVEEVESKGFECLVVGSSIVFPNQSGFALLAMPWSDSIENLLRREDSGSSDPFVVGLTTKKIRFGEIDIIERSGQQQSTKNFCRERAFVNKQIAYRFIVVNTLTPVGEMDAEILGNLSFISEYKQFSSPEKQPIQKEREVTSVKTVGIKEEQKQVESPKIPIGTNKIKIAIMEFQNLNEESKRDNYGSMFAEMLTTSFVGSEAFKITEREQLKKVAQELQYTQSGIIDVSQAKQLGKLVGADAIVTGSVTKIGDDLRLDARIIDVESGIILTAEKITGKVNLGSIGDMADMIVNNLVNKFYGNKK